jgi:hypothetical protein
VKRLCLARNGTRNDVLGERMNNDPWTIRRRCHASCLSGYPREQRPLRNQLVTAHRDDQLATPARSFDLLPCM